MVDNGQKKFLPDRPFSDPNNHYVFWNELTDLMQSDPDKALGILRYQGHPSRDDIDARPIPWVSAQVEGTVTNGFLSGEDYAGDHRPKPIEYWLGSPAPKPEYARDEGHYPDDNDCGTLSRITNALCNDWKTYIRPDPDYHCVS